MSQQLQQVHHDTCRRCPDCNKFMKAEEWHRDETGAWVRWWDCVNGCHSEQGGKAVNDLRKMRERCAQRGLLHQLWLDEKLRWWYSNAMREIREEGRQATKKRR